MIQARQWHQLKSIIADALDEGSTTARIDFIRRSCANDDDLVRAAKYLLAQPEIFTANGTDELESCAEAAAPSLAVDSSVIGRRIGAYNVLRLIGHGGMGAVYLAERVDGCFEKQVAIKLLAAGVKTEEAVHRFQAERKVLASLDHPNITRMIDAGTTDDEVPYFIMEYVDGIPLAIFIETEQLSLRARLELFLKITSAVQCAHDHGIIHRDLKPSNILVNRDGEPKLLDFGIAKFFAGLSDPQFQTVSGRERISPLFASPEQVKGDAVTVSSDVYSLGVVLYGLVTGSFPFRFRSDAPSSKEILAAICKQVPLRPSLAVTDRRRERELRGDLDAIILRALQKDPLARYQTVIEFAEDVRSHLDRKPIQARSSETGYQIKTSILHDWRIRFAGGLVALILLSIFLAFGIRGWRNLNVEQPSGKIGIAVLPFDNFAGGKESNYFADGVQEAIQTDLANVSALKVISRGSVTSYRESQKNERDIGKALGVQYLLEGTVQRTGDNVRVDAHLVDTKTVATVWAQQYDRKLGDLFAVESELAQAIVAQLKTRLSPDEKAAIEVAPTRDMLAYDLYLRARESLFQNNCPNAIRLLEQAVSRDPQFALAQAALAEANLYQYRFEGDRTPARLDSGNAAAELALRLAPKLPQSHLAKAQYYYYGLKDYEHALAELTIGRSCGGYQAEFIDLSALIERRLGRWKDAIRDAEHATELDPQNPFIINELVESYISVRRFADAEFKARQTIDAAVTRSGYLWTQLAEALLAEGQIDEARAVTQQAPDNMSRMIEFVWEALYARDFARASELNTEAQSMKGSTWPFEDFDGDLFAGVIARATGDRLKAQKDFERTRENLLRQLKEKPNELQLITNLSLADAALGHKDDALREATRAIELCPVSHDAVDGPNYQAALAMVYAWLGDHDSAIAVLEEAVSKPRGPTFGELRFSPFWDDLRGDSRFDSLLVKASSPPTYD